MHRHRPSISLDRGIKYDQEPTVAAQSPTMPPPMMSESPMSDGPGSAGNHSRPNLNLRVHRLIQGNDLRRPAAARNIHSMAMGMISYIIMTPASEALPALGNVVPKLVSRIIATLGARSKKDVMSRRRRGEP